MPVAETEAQALPPDTGSNSARKPGRRILIVVVVAIALSMSVLRFVNIGRAYFWGDEATTIVSSCPRPTSEFRDFAARMIRSDQLSAFLREKSGYSPYQSLKNIKELCDHVPAFYFLAGLWVLYFGNTYVTLRTLAALMSIVQLPLIAWLCTEAFGGVLIPALAVVFIAVSPFFFAYAREAREYSFWACTTILSTVLLLRAMRKQSPADWNWFAAAQGLNLLTHYASLLYVVLIAVSLLKEKMNLKRYLLASLPALILCACWTLFASDVLLRRNALTSWLNRPTSAHDLVRGFAVNWGHLLVDVSSPISNKLLFISILLVAVAAAIFLKNAHKWRALFGVTLVGFPLLLLGADLTSSGIRSQYMRYQVPPIVFFYVVLAYVVGRGLMSGRTSVRALATLSCLFVVGGGIWSCSTLVTVQRSWTKCTVFEEKAAAAMGPNPGSDSLFVGGSYGLLTLTQFIPACAQVERVGEPLIVPDQITKVVLSEPNPEVVSGLVAGGFKCENGSTIVYTRAKPATARSGEN